MASWPTRHKDIARTYGFVAYQHAHEFADWCTLNKACMHLAKAVVMSNLPGQLEILSTGLSFRSI